MRRRARRKKSFFSFYSCFAILSGLLLTAFVLLADKLVEYNVYFYINYRGITTGKMFVVIVFAACFLLVSGIAVFLHRHFKHAFIRGIIILFIMAVACYVAFSTLFAALFFMPRSYVGVVSNDGEHRIILGEDNRINAPYGGDVYERTSLFTMRKVGEYSTTHEFYKPFSSGKFYIDWNEADFDIHYDHNGNGEYKTITFKYLK